MSELVAADGYSRRLGERLRSVRRQKHLSLQAVEASSRQEFKASVLGAYERGERAISVPRLQRLARFYDVPVDQLLVVAAPLDDGPVDDGPVDGGPVGDGRGESGPVEGGRGEDGPGENGSLAIDLTRLDQVPTPERDLLGRYLSTIQKQRRDLAGRVVAIRRDDLRAIAMMLGTPVEAMRSRLEELGLRS